MLSEKWYFMFYIPLYPEYGISQIYLSKKLGNTTLQIKWWLSEFSWLYPPLNP